MNPPPTESSCDKHRKVALTFAPAAPERCQSVNQDSSSSGIQTLQISAYVESGYWNVTHLRSS